MGEKRSRRDSLYEQVAKRAKLTHRPISPKRGRPVPDEGEQEGARRGASRRAPLQNITPWSNVTQGDVPDPDPVPREERTGDG